MKRKRQSPPPALTFRQYLIAEVLVELVGRDDTGTFSNPHEFVAREAVKYADATISAMEAKRK